MTRFIDVHPTGGVNEEMLKKMQNELPDEFGVVKFLAPDETPGGIDISIMKVEPDMSLYEIATLIDESKI